MSTPFHILLVPERKCLKSYFFHKGQEKVIFHLFFDCVHILLTLGINELSRWIFFQKYRSSIRYLPKISWTEHNYSQRYIHFKSCLFAPKIFFFSSWPQIFDFFTKTRKKSVEKCDKNPFWGIIYSSNDDFWKFFSPPSARFPTYNEFFHESFAMEHPVHMYSVCTCTIGCKSIWHFSPVTSSDFHNSEVRKDLSEKFLPGHNWVLNLLLKHIWGGAHIGKCV